MLKNILKEQIENNSVFHSYIFEGNSDEIKEQYLEFSKKLLRFEGNAENIVEVIRTEKSTISISLIRELTKRVYEAPAGYKYRIMVIEDAHLMRVEAQNALLKTLEELPSYSIVIMTTDNRNKLLNTIISRSQVISLRKNIVNFDKELFGEVFSLIQKALSGNYYIISKEKDTFKILSERKVETLFILTHIFSELMQGRKNIDGKQLNQSYLIKNSIEEIILRIEKIKALLNVNINFQIAIESLLFLIIAENIKSKKLMDKYHEKN